MNLLAYWSIGAAIMLIFALEYMVYEPLQDEEYSHSLAIHRIFARRHLVIW